MIDILIVTSLRRRREDALAMLTTLCTEAVGRAWVQANVECLINVRLEVSSIQERIAAANIVLADVSGSRQELMYELGFAHANGKPTILVSDERGKPTLHDISRQYVHLYPMSGHDPAFRERLISELAKAIRDPQQFLIGSQKDSPLDSRPTVFISYSHSDRECLERLRVHLRPLQLERALDYWDDSSIVAGDRWRDEIKAALEHAKIAVLLISADFLASDFVVESELPVLLAAAEKRGTTIVPVVLKPCRFLRDTQLSAFQCINDPKSPLMGLSEVKREEVYARIAERTENELRDKM